jgi:acyl-CoA thioester hydrolase
METPKVPPSASMRFRVRLRTRWSDEDNQGVLNNAVYLTLFEETRFAYFTRLGLLSKNQFPFLLAQTNVVFLSPGRGGAEVEAEAATVHLGTSSFTQVYRVRDVASGVAWCEAEARLVAWDNQRGAKMNSMQADFRARMAEFEGLAPR